MTMPLKVAKRIVLANDNEVVVEISTKMIEYCSKIEKDTLSSEHIDVYNSSRPPLSFLKIREPHHKNSHVSVVDNKLCLSVSGRYSERVNPSGSTVSLCSSARYKFVWHIRKVPQFIEKAIFDKAQELAVNLVEKEEQLTMLERVARVRNNLLLPDSRIDYTKTINYYEERINAHP